jgi:hypothetical protein
LAALSGNRKKQAARLPKNTASGLSTILEVRSGTEAAWLVRLINAMNGRWSSGAPRLRAASHPAT